MCKIMLAKEIVTEYSIEAGKADGVNHFDHHNLMSDNPAPCNDDRIVPIENGDITITHIDADTLMGLFRMLGKELPEGIDFELMERIDLNGSSIIRDKFDSTLLYMVGVSQKARELEFPRCGAEPTDVTDKVKELMKYSDEFVEIGRVAQLQSETTYNNNWVIKTHQAILFEIDENQPLNPSRPYEDLIDVVVVYRKHLKTISIYCNPKSDYKFGNTTVADIKFAGHPQACGSPHGVEYTADDAMCVFAEIHNTIRDKSK